MWSLDDTVSRPSLKMSLLGKQPDHATSCNISGICPGEWVCIWRHCGAFWRLSVCVWMLLAFLSRNSEIHPVLVEKVACATVSTHLYILSSVQVQFYPPCWQLLSDSGDFSNRVCHYYGWKGSWLWTQRTFCLSLLWLKGILTLNTTNILF